MGGVSVSLDGAPREIRHVVCDRDEARYDIGEARPLFLFVAIRHGRFDLVPGSVERRFRTRNIFGSQ